MIKVKKIDNDSIIRLDDEYGNHFLIPRKEWARLGGLLMYYGGELVGNVDHMNNTDEFVEEYMNGELMQRHPDNYNEGNNDL